MGFILSKFRKKKSTLDVLEKIESDLTKIKEYKQNTEAWERKILRSTITYSVVFYLMMMLIVYFKYFPEAKNVNEKLWLLLPFFLAPVIIYILRRFLTWWYHRKIRNNDTKLKKLQETKAKILEDVMEKETYKVAKEILEKFAPGQLSGPSVSGGPRNPNTLPVTSRSPLPRPCQPDIRQRRPVVGPAGPGPAGTSLNQPIASTTSLPSTSSLNQTIATVPSRSDSSVPSAGPRPPMAPTRGAQGPPLPRPVLPRERGYLDKLVEYLVGDGPSNRYALICRQCQSHNGMALREEFEYIAYRCCYCYYWNPARKQRPVAPRLPDPGQVRTEDTDSSRSSSVSGSRSSSRAGSMDGRAALKLLDGGRRDSQSEPEGNQEIKLAEESKHNEEVATVINSEDPVENIGVETEEDTLASTNELVEPVDELVEQSEEVVQELVNPQDGVDGRVPKEQALQNKVEQMNEVVKSDGDFELVNAQERVTTDSDDAMEIDGTI